MQRRVVITGIGLITPIGNDMETTWSSLLAGKNGAAPTTLFDVTDFATKFSCEVKNWEPSKFFDKRELKHLDRFLQFGVAAGMMAVADAGLGTRVPAGQEDRWGSFIRARDVSLARRYDVLLVTSGNTGLLKQVESLAGWQVRYNGADGIVAVRDST